VFGVERRRGILKGLGTDALMILALSGRFGLTVAVNSALGAVRASNGRVPLVGELPHARWFIASGMRGTAFVLALLDVATRICRARTRPRPALIGLFRWAFGWNAGAIRDVTVVYGAASGVASFIVWHDFSTLAFSPAPPSDGRSNAVSGFLHRATRPNFVDIAAEASL
jgi:hypothetical protein